jgi:hypothetical protein
VKRLLALLFLLPVVALAQNIDSIRLGGPYYGSALAITPTPSPTPYSWERPMGAVISGTPLEKDGTVTSESGASPTPSPTPNVHPGYWQVQPGIFVPCNGIKPFQPFVNVGDGITYYLGGDVNANIAHPNLYGTYIDAIYYNHTRAYYDAEGFITPMIPQLGPPNFYPAPSTSAALCTQWTNLGNSTTCPSGTDAQYTTRFLSNAVWTQSYAFYAPSIQIACNGVQPTAPPTATRTPTPTPIGPTRTPSPDPFAAWDEELFREGITAGCAAGPYFCPDSPLTREQAAVWILKAIHGPTYVPPKCTGVFLDVPCSPTLAPAKVGQ